MKELQLSSFSFDQLSVGNWFQNVCFYIFLGGIIFGCFRLIKLNDAIRQNRQQYLHGEDLLYVLSLSQVAIAIYSGPDFVIQTATSGMLGYLATDTRIIGLRFATAFPGARFQEELSMLQRVRDTGRSYKYTDSGQNPNPGSSFQPRCFKNEYQVIKNNGGEAYCILHIKIDITAEHLEKKTLKDENSKLIRETFTLGEQLKLAYVEVQRLRHTVKSEENLNG